MIFENPKSLVSNSPQKSENIVAHERGGRLITNSDFDELKYHIIDLPQLIPKDLLMGPYHQNTRLAVAYQCYSNAIYKLDAPNEILSEVIRGIESLYLPMDRNPGKGSRLARRVAAVLSNEDLDAREIKTNIKESYFAIRNPTSHGTPLDKKKQFSANERIPVLIEYLRNSILILIKEENESFIDRF